jgi:hypothetical protein
MSPQSACLGLTLVFAVALLSGCASERWIYEKPNVTPARLDSDLAACRKESVAPGRIAIFQSGRVDQDALNRCMQRRGYKPRRESLGAVTSSSV